MPTEGRLLNPVFDNRPMYRTERACRACGCPDLHRFLDLGEMPLADRLLTSEWDCRAEPRFPLAAALCTECGLVQLTETVRPELLFADQYPYYSSVSRSVLDHAAANVAARLDERRLDRSSLVVEIGSNDGYLLRNYAAAGVTVLGIDPAEGPARAARAARIETMAEFFTANLAHDIRQRRGEADIVHASNVLTHSDDLRGFVTGIAVLMKPDGVAVIEVPYLRDMVEGLQFDTIHHQHLCYFSLGALDRLLRGAGLFANRVERLAIHGGSLRVFAERREETDASVTEMLAQEREIGIGTRRFFADLAKDSDRLRGELVGMIEELARQRPQDRRLWRGGKGRGLAQRLRVGPASHRLRRRSQHAQAGAADAGRAPADPPARGAVRGAARLHAAAGLEFRRRDPGAAGRLPRGGRQVHRAAAPPPHRLTAPPARAGRPSGQRRNPVR